MGIVDNRPCCTPNKVSLPRDFLLSSRRAATFPFLNEVIEPRLISRRELDKLERDQISTGGERIERQAAPHQHRHIWSLFT